MKLLLCYDFKLPQYAVGHGARVAAIEDGVAALPGLAVAGAALHGVGVPACLATADAAAARVVAHLAPGGERAHPADRAFRRGSGGGKVSP